MSRGSFNNNQSLPYQIYNETLNTGKNLGSSKTKVRWRFGWSNEEGEHDIEFVHSKLSGKRTLLEDGREIIATTNVLSLEFSHGWTSNGHMFRIEAVTGISEDSTYSFTIDGVPFNQLPYREEAKRRMSTLGGADASKYVGRYDGVSSSDSNERRPSFNSNNGSGRDSFSNSGRDSFSNRNSGSRQFNLQSPNVNVPKHADPFAEPLPVANTKSSDFARDPFENDPFAAKSDPFASQPTNTSKSAASSIFPSATPSTSSSNDAFDPFATPSAAIAAPPPQQQQQQQFQPQPPQFSSSGFAVLPGAAPVPPPLPAKKVPERKDNPFISGRSESDPFALQSSAPAPAPANAQTSFSQPDLFDSPVTTTADTNSKAVLPSFDPFASDVSSFGSNLNNTAADQGGDGGLLSINFSMPANVQSPQMQHSPQLVQDPLQLLPEPPVQEDVKCTVTKGINSLVDLDLGGSNIKKETERRLSSNQGPSLTSLMGSVPTNNSTNSTASLTNSMSNFDPFGGNPMASSQPSMGGMTMQGQQGLGMTNNMNNNGMMMMQPPMGAMQMGVPPSMMGGNGFAPPPLASNPNSNIHSASISMMQPQSFGMNMNNNSCQDTTKQKTSLDSLGGW